MGASTKFIKSASGTSVSSLSVTDCFSADYDVYFVEVAKSLNSVEANLDIRFIDSGGSIIADSEYDYATLQLNSNTSFGERRSTGNTKISRLVVFGGDEQKTGGTGYAYVYNPYDSSSYTFTQGASQGIQGTTFQGDKQIGVHKSAEQITGIAIIPSGGTTTLIINVYGVKG